MGRCADCGILIREALKNRCCRYNTELTKDEIFQERDCLYYTEPQFDDGELISPAQLILLKEMDLKSKKLQGPV